MPSAENRVGITRWERPSLTNTARFVDFSIWRDVPKNGCVRLSSGSARDCRTFFLGWAACMIRPVAWIESWRQASWMIVWQDSCQMFDRLGSIHHDHPVGEGMYRDLTKDLLRDQTSQLQNGKRAYLTTYIKLWYLHGGSSRGSLYMECLSRPVTHVAPQCWNASYWRTRYCFGTFLDRHRNKFLYQFKVSSSWINSVLAINLSCHPFRTQNHGLVWARQELDKCIIHIPGTNDVPNAN